ncbi:unnamed protein product [Euphydryas editha]|uniref:Tyrosine-protein phosphatase domain-containing protein n=1 Tax=Euphydryas editha TaxID=104508 RepID=A0AAU9TR03_EUPED|nr:unnamed protein product [Euphydryas editha]
MLQTNQILPGPIVVHGEKDIGRTAAYCVADICLYQIAHTASLSVASTKQAWIELCKKYSAFSETGFRAEKQLHALYDNIKKKARKNMSDDKSQIYKTGGGTFCSKITQIDEKVVTLLTPQFKPLSNEFTQGLSWLFLFYA